MGEISSFVSYYLKFHNNLKVGKSLHNFGAYYLVHVRKRSSFLHRSRIDIIACILEKATGKARKTHVMYSCNLSFRQFQVYLDLLTENGLITSQKAKESEIETLKTTNEGRAFLEAYRKLKAFLAATRSKA